MSNNTIHEQIAELCNQAGPIQGYFLPVAEVQRLLLAEREQVLRLEGERGEALRSVKELQEECERLTQEMAKVRAERDAYERTAYAHVRDEFLKQGKVGFAPEEYAVPVADVIVECRQLPAEKGTRAWDRPNR